jgi:hypothetical protein
VRSAYAQRIPIVDLPPAPVKTSETLGAVLGVRAVAGGRVLVNDAGRRQVKLYDSTLAAPTVVIDSTAGGSNSYGPTPSKIIPYLGDSTLFADIGSQTFLVLDAMGKVARAMAPPNLQAVRAPPGNVDNKGRLLWLAPTPVSPTGAPADSSLILRADFETRRVDTAGRVRRPAFKIRNEPRADGTNKTTITVNPLPSIDEWAVLSDGSIAFVRGQDYHIDWIRPDGSQSSTPKLPFDWRRLTDDDKQKLVDSARAAQNIGRTLAAANPPPGGGGGGGAGTGGRSGGGGDPNAPRPAPPTIEYVPLNEINDYYPPIRGGAARPDLDGNLWILPTTSAQSQSGELVYDVVNVKGELFERVRVPSGRSIIGFGKGGVVYLLSGDRTNGFYLERTRLPAAPPK